MSIKPYTLKLINYRLVDELREVQLLVHAFNGRQTGVFHVGLSASQHEGITIRIGHTPGDEVSRKIAKQVDRKQLEDFAIQESIKVGIRELKMGVQEQPLAIYR